MEFNKEKYLKLVNFLRANTGRVFALYDPPAGQMVKPLGMDRQPLRKLPGLQDKDALIFHLKSVPVNCDLETNIILNTCGLRNYNSVD